MIMMNKLNPFYYLLLVFQVSACAGLQASTREQVPAETLVLTPPPVEEKAPTQQTVGDPALYYNYLMAQISRSEGDVEVALAHYRAASALDPDSTMLMFDLANLYVRAGQLDESKQECLKIIRKDPNHFHARLLLAGINSALGSKEEAIE